jgi:hypothetical protein
VILIYVFINYEIEGDELKDIDVVLLTTISYFLTVQEKCLCYSLDKARDVYEIRKRGDRRQHAAYLTWSNTQTNRTANPGTVSNCTSRSVG